MLTDKEKKQSKEEVQAEAGIFQDVLDEKLQPIHKKLDALQKELSRLTQGAISAVTGVDALNDEKRQNKTSQN